MGQDTWWVHTGLGGMAWTLRSPGYHWFVSWWYVTATEVIFNSQCRWWRWLLDPLLWLLLWPWPSLVTEEPHPWSLSGDQFWVGQCQGLSPPRCPTWPSPVEVWSLAMYCNAKYCPPGKRESPPRPKWLYVTLFPQVIPDWRIKMPTDCSWAGEVGGGLFGSWA